MTTRNASESPPQGWRDLETYQTYLDALELEKTAPGTVCITKSHYQDHRHPIPYREGYCHRYRLPDQHYHRTHEELVKCEEENYDR